MKNTLTYLFVGISAVIVTIFLAPKAHAAISFVQISSSTVGSQTVISSTLASNVTAGNLIVVAISWGFNANSITAPTDNRGTTYTLAASSSRACTGLVECRLAIWYAPNFSTTGSLKVSSTFDTIENSSMVVAEYSGAATTNVLNTSSTNTGTGATTNSGNVTPAANNLMFGATTSNCGSSTTCVSGSNNGFTTRALVDGTNLSIGTNDQIATSTAVASSSFTLAASYQWLDSVVTFNAAPAAGGTTGLGNRLMSFKGPMKFRSKYIFR